MAVAFNERGGYEWEEFRQRLIAEIALGQDNEYYASWLRAFETLLLERHALTANELASRTYEFLAMRREEVF
jgi:hypothetical protein